MGMGIAEHVEVEVKLDVTDDAVMSALDDLIDGVSVSAESELVLDAVYFDTRRGDLARAGATLRHRVGGTDAGWHLKLSGPAAARTELRVPDETAVDEVPVELLERVRGLVRNRPVAPVARIQTHRSLRSVLGVDGRVLVEVCDDRVTARAPGQGVTRTWREWEVELVEGRDADLRAISSRLEATAGASPAAYRSKLERALDGETARPDRGVAASRRRAGGVARDLVRAHLDELLEADIGVRAGDPDAVHAIRVAARRLRSTLTTFDAVLAPHPGPDLRDELRWFGGELGPARDAEVMLARLRSRIAELPTELVIGPVPERLTIELTAAASRGADRARSAMRAPRYYRLLDGLEALTRPDLELPSAASSATGSSAKTLVRTSLRADLARVRRAMRAADRAPGPGPARDAALHEVRKKAKRLRYASESAVAQLGRPARRLGERARDLQTVLGEHQDSVVARHSLIGLADRARRHREDGFTYGLLFAREEEAAQALERPSARARRRLVREAERRRL